MSIEGYRELVLTIIDLLSMPSKSWEELLLDYNRYGMMIEDVQATRKRLWSETKPELESAAEDEERHIFFFFP